MTLFKKLLIASLILFPLAGSAQNPPAPSAFIQPDVHTKYEISKAFKYYKLVWPQLSVPSVVEIPFDQESFAMPFFAVYNLDTSLFEPYELLVNRVETKSFIEANGAGDPYKIQDQNYETYLEFPLYGYASRAEITFSFEKPITASSLYFTLDEFVALPQKISVSAVVSGKDYIVLAPVKPEQNSIVFPKTTSSTWRVVFDHAQPLRISEMQFGNLSADQPIDRNLRFLAQPGQTYQVYFDADRYVRSPEKEAGDLLKSKNAVYPEVSLPISNSDYQPADSDMDGVPDLSDNCASISNSGQEDQDGNNRGDACEDYDWDGVLNGKDNCRESPNREQADTDGDEVGDVCDSFDNRVTERMPWLPWVGIGIAGAVLLGLFFMVLKYKPTAVHNPEN